MRCWVFAALLFTTVGSAQAQDAANGEKVFAQCRACHQVGETAKNAVDPFSTVSLAGRQGQSKGTITRPRTRTPA